MFCTLKDATGRVRFKTVAVTDYADDHEGVLLLVLAGQAQQAVRAVWANLVKRRTGCYTQETEITLHADDGDRTIKVNPEHHFRSAWVGNTTLIIVRDELCKEHATVIFGGDRDTPSAWFPIALRNIPEMPYRDEWLPELWRAAIEAELVGEVPGSTTPLWSIYLAKPRWLDLIKKLVTARRVH